MAPVVSAICEFGDMLLKRAPSSPSWSSRMGDLMEMPAGKLETGQAADEDAVDDGEVVAAVGVGRQQI